MKFSNLLKYKKQFTAIIFVLIVTIVGFTIFAINNSEIKSLELYNNWECVLINERILHNWGNTVVFNWKKYWSNPSPSEMGMDFGNKYTIQSNGSYAQITICPRPKLVKENGLVQNNTSFLKDSISYSANTEKLWIICEIDDTFNGNINDTIVDRINIWALEITENDVTVPLIIDFVKTWSLEDSIVTKMKVHWTIKFNSCYIVYSDNDSNLFTLEQDKRYIHKTMIIFSDDKKEIIDDEFKTAKKYDLVLWEIQNSFPVLWELTLRLDTKQQATGKIKCDFGIKKDDSVIYDIKDINVLDDWVINLSLSNQLSKWETYDFLYYCWDKLSSTKKETQNWVYTNDIVETKIIARDDLKVISITPDKAVNESDLCITFNNKLNEWSILNVSVNNSTWNKFITDNWYKYCLKLWPVNNNTSYNIVVPTNVTDIYWNNLISEHKHTLIIEKEKIKEKVKENDVKENIKTYLVPAKFHWQEQETSCVIASVKIALSTYWIDKTEKEIFSKLWQSYPIEHQCSGWSKPTLSWEIWSCPEWENLIWWDWSKWFVWDIYAKSQVYSIGSEVYTSWLRAAKHWAPWSYDISGSDPSVLFNAIANWHPVIYERDRAPHLFRYCWYTTEGKKLCDTGKKHAKVLVWYTINKKTWAIYDIKVYDPYYWILTYNYNDFVKDYNSMKQAIVVKP